MESSVDQTQHQQQQQQQPQHQHHDQHHDAQSTPSDLHHDDADSQSSQIDASTAQHLLQSLPADLTAHPVDSLTCQWVGCGERCSHPEALYDHVCERHIGRKSTNNLNLTCAWGLCRTTTVKRDHITSHMRVHVPLKPHKCDFCSKSFKRPQDLKKHVKTHADDSAAMHSSNDHIGYHQDDNKGAFFPPHDMGLHSYPSATSIAQNGNYFAQQYPQYAAVGYPANNVDQHSLDTRRRAIEALNDFLGDIRRRSLDPKSYYDVGERLNTQGLPLPVSIGAGYSLGGSQYQHPAAQPRAQNHTDAFANAAYATQADAGTASLAQNYALPMSNARTKADLLDIDRFLEQLQATVYESNPTSSQVGFRDVSYNHSQGYQPNQHHDRSSLHLDVATQPLTSVAQMAAMTASAQGIDTPALTSASISSHSSAHSPQPSTHTHSSIDNSMYPQLPSVTGISEMGQTFSSATSVSLASTFDDGRRYRGGRLQRQAPDHQQQDTVAQAMDLDEQDGGRTPKKIEDLKQETSDQTSTNVDPALRSTSSSHDANLHDPVKEENASVALASDTNAEEASRAGSSETDRAQEAWMENVRTIETLRNWVRERIEQGHFDAESTEEHDTSMDGDDDKYNDPAEKDLSQALKRSLQQQEAESQQQESEAAMAHSQQIESSALQPPPDAESSDLKAELKSGLRCELKAEVDDSTQMEERVAYPTLEAAA